MIKYVFLALMILPIPASAQFVPAPIGLHFQSDAAHPRETRVMSAGTGTPRWVKWGIVGAVAGGALFALAGQSNTDHNHSTASDALYGAATGFVILGGGIALWDWLCHGDTRSRRSGLCGG
jgi:hypothetical protein